jgi:hypothetical protein
MDESRSSKKKRAKSTINIERSESLAGDLDDIGNEQRKARNKQRTPRNHNDF